MTAIWRRLTAPWSPPTRAAPKPAPAAPQPQDDGHHTQLLDETRPAVDMDRLWADLRALAAGKRPDRMRTELIDCVLHAGMCLDDMIRDDAAELLHLIERRRFAEQAAMATIPAKWRA